MSNKRCESHCVTDNTEAIKQTMNVSAKVFPVNPKPDISFSCGRRISIIVQIQFKIHLKLNLTLTKTTPQMDGCCHVRFVSI